jgi:hypothetical protein
MRYAFIILLCALTLSASALPKDSLPQTFLLKPAALAAVKQQLQKGDPALQQALKILLSDADKALQHGPYSVVYKSKTPPGGSKHDYMSVGPYWWPDSSKADGLPYIRKDGQVNPERFNIRDAEYYTALCRDVYTLGLAWFYTGRRAYSAKAVQQLRTWFLADSTRMNPDLNYGQAIPGITQGRGIGLIDTRNLTKLIDGVQLLKASPDLGAADYRGLQEWYRQFLQWMRTSSIGLDEADEHNNHGTWYDVQTVSIALFTGQPQLAREILQLQTMPRIESQLKEDGSQPHELARTLSWNYSSMNLKGFFELALLAENVRIDLWRYQTPGGKSLQKAFAWMLPFAAGEKEWEYKQIKSLDYTTYVELAVEAQQKYPQLNLAPLWKKYSAPADARLPVMLWAF